MYNKRERLNFLEQEIASKLKNMRHEVGFTSPQQVSKEIGAGIDSIYKLETMQSIPTKKTIYSLVNVYRMNNKEINDLIELRNEILELRKELKVMNNEY